jgi:cytochrome c556
MAARSFASFACVAVLSLTLAACADEAAPAGDTVARGPEPEAIKARQDNFEKIGDSFKAIRGQLETGAPDLAVIETAATDMNAAAIAVKDQFPEGSSVEDDWDTEALAVIWEKPDEFTKAHTLLVDESAQMITLAQGGDAAAVAAHVANVGKACKNCHDTFRLKTD